MPNILSTDAYKIAMAQAGFPLREETFYLSFRKGGWQYVPFDLAEIVRGMLPKDYLAQADGVGDYKFTSAMAVAMATQELKIRCVPAGSWVYEREPILTITGPSFLVSWLEPQVLRLFFPIQLATNVLLAKVQDAELRFTCDEQLEIAKKTILSTAEDSYANLSSRWKVDPQGYANAVRAQVRKLLTAVSADRIFEVGMRSATCEEQHTICLRVLREEGIESTSNVSLATQLGMKPVGTMGHEHVQRWGSDLVAYRAMRDMTTIRPTYLLDTFNTITSGIPNAILAMREANRPAAVRYDSGDKFGQYIYAHGQFEQYGLEPTHVIEDGLDYEATVKFERLREHTGLSPERQVYGYGGHLVSSGWDNPLTRDRVSAVYKLSETSGEPRMKLGDEQGLGKVSVPGVPAIWRRLRGNGPFSIIAQKDERVPEDYVSLMDDPGALPKMRLCGVQYHPNHIFNQKFMPNPDYVLSPETQNMVARLRNR